MIDADTEMDMNESYALLAHVIKSYNPDTLDENTFYSLKFMANHENFSPIHDVIEDKILEIADYFKGRKDTQVTTNLEGKPVSPKPKRTPDNRKKKKRASNAGDIPDNAIQGPSMTFVTDPQSGLLVPIVRSDS
jgi:hypothetical protein